ncbi:MAG: hypothetical protein G01um101418_190 [Parcubacteria group bacterium Gr01-1014_18]|nr:MAG: hypothetical protein Greene041636_158 [Parcubacteria group bacterium Greene0416_36]TSC81350.1 MAG: hypothetical protein G01um101418_190 [Parcubacteria group bacterium Gr01-1014_18]TSC99464.1 MAG: hypothetical protein Greene101420_131 [Parcubacteria group bacterium Greene1014_20]TSD07617.1 MAG: hypothetical protein Greene07142_74 [Parcubacteria group bacterium Greene0714_2]
MLLERKKIPTWKQIRSTPKILSRRENLLLKILLSIIVLSFAYIGASFILNRTQLVAQSGGKYTEGSIGTPLYLNPLFSQTSDIDNDISSLVYSGLLKYNKEQELVPDLALDYEISSDSLIYTLTLRQDVYWHDGAKFNADDVVATLDAILDPAYQSPLFLSLRGVEYQKIDPHTLKFSLKKPFAPFPTLLTFGILPKHIWAEIPAVNWKLVEYNRKPIGSGPWKFDSLEKDKKGTILSYTLVRNDNFYGERPYLEKIEFRFFANTTDLTLAIQNGTIDGINFLPQKEQDSIRGNQHLITHPLSFPQYTAIFFNQDQNNILQNKTVRQALSLAISKQKIIDYALEEQGKMIDNPLLSLGPQTPSDSYDPQKANQLLEEAGYQKISQQEYKDRQKKQAIKQLRTRMEKNFAAKKDSEKDKTLPAALSDKDPKNIPDQELEPFLENSATPSISQEFFREKDGHILSISLTTVDHPENKKAAELIRDYWEKIGAQVELKLFDAPKIQKEIIKKRQYEALLYGQNIGLDPDPYAFWHSSQAKDPGLNLTSFADKNADKLIIDARQNQDLTQREVLYKQFLEILSGEIPALFLYSPTYNYILSNDIKNFDIDHIVKPSDRFNNLSEWYIETKRVWK